MLIIKRVIPVLVLGALMALAAPAPAAEDGPRTANRTIFGTLDYPDWLFARPDHDEFLPQNSNRVAHPGAWDGQDWDPSRWNSAWTEEATLKKFFRARIFERQYMRNGQIPAVELGPTFYRLSDLDKRRSLKLLTDYSAFFKRGYRAVALVDWSTRHIVGSYTPKGMFLN